MCVLVCLHVFAYVCMCVHKQMFERLVHAYAFCTNNIGHTNVYEIYYCPAVRRIIHFKINLSQFVCCSVTKRTTKTNGGTNATLCWGKWKTPHKFNTITTQYIQIYTRMAITVTTKQCNKMFTWIHNKSNNNNNEIVTTKINQ